MSEPTFLDAALARFDAIDLDELNQLAELRVRVDRKYILPDVVVGRLLKELDPTLRVLEIGGDRTFAYESTYFDTPDRALYHAAARKRRLRFKVRTRSYSSAPDTVLEVKTKDSAGRTIKHRGGAAVDPGELTEESREFVRQVVGRSDADLGLAPVLVTRYDRSTLVDGRGGARLTIDRNLVCELPGGHAVGLSDVVCETKSPRVASLFDRWFWRHGRRPISFSKYCTALAALDPDLPANKWHRTLRRHPLQPVDRTPG